MNYSQWRSEYWKRKARWLLDNEARFGALLFNLRSAIYIPAVLGVEFSKALSSSMASYALSYEALIVSRVVSAVAFESAGLELLGAPYAQEALSRGLSGPLGVTLESPVEKTLPSGMRLSERIWDLQNYRKDIEETVRRGLVSHASPETIARQLDGFVRPDRMVTTRTPYGRALNFDSMRLARTETMNAFRNAQIEAMRRTPWIEGVRWELSSSHKDLCACDDLDGKVFGPQDTVPDAPHPQCACCLVPVVMDIQEFARALDFYVNQRIDDIGINDWLEEAA